MVITCMSDNEHRAWEDYVKNHPHGTPYHMPQWKNCIERAYGHKSYYLMALEGKKPRDARITGAADDGNQNAEVLSIRGILPLVHIRHVLFGNNLISMPFCDLGGILADDEATGKALLNKAIDLGHELSVGRIELRHAHTLRGFEDIADAHPDRLRIKVPSPTRTKCTTFTDKVRMILPLPDSSQTLMTSFRSKLRSQIKKPLKQGLTTNIGGGELLEDFYDVFLVNMRDLGSPVHSKELISSFVHEFSPKARIVTVCKEGKILAASVVVGFKDTLSNPWASSLREYSSLSPNMLLYWKMLEYACDQGYARFDFGRSSVHESTYKFKEQWGAQPETLCWHNVALDGVPLQNSQEEKHTYRLAIEYWKKLPLPVTKLIGPRLRGYIAL